MKDAYYELAPQMRHYLALGGVYCPYLMETTIPNHQSPHFSTDGFGFRTTYHQGVPLSLETFHGPDYAGRRAILAGNSTAFGVGASHDRHTIASHLNNHSDWIWFNLAGRRYQSTQELIAFLLFAPNTVERVVILSGINNFDFGYAWRNDHQVFTPPFIGQKIYQSALDRLCNPPPPTPGRVRRILNRLRGITPPPPPSKRPRNFLPEAVAHHFAPPHDNVSTFPQHPERMQRMERALRTLDRDLARWAALTNQTPDAITFVLQPVPEWLRKAPHPQEQHLLSLVAAQRGSNWQSLAGFLEGQESHYRDGTRRLCEKHGIPFFDANTAPTLKGPEWIFLDRYHLTDRGQALLANAINTVIKP